MPLPITEFDVQALVDSQVTREEENRIWRGICRDPFLNGYYKQIVAQKKLIIAWWRSEAGKEGGNLQGSSGVGLETAWLLNRRVK